MESSDTSHVTEAVIRRGLQEGAFVPWFQPVASLATGSPAGYAVLGCLTGPENSLYLPESFQPAAARTGLLGEVERQILHRAASHLAQLPEPYFMMVLVSGAALAEAAFVDEAAELMAVAADPSRLRLMISHSDATAFAEAIQTLGALGVRWYLDGCGTGILGVGPLVDLGIAGVVLDPSITEGIGAGDPRSVHVGRALVGLARGLGLDLVAKGVSAPNAATALAGQGWKMGLGSLYGSPTAVIQLPSRVDSGADANASTAHEPLERDLAAARAAHAATREILRARDTGAAQAALLTLCGALGAQLTDGESTDPDVVPIDLGLGEGESILPRTGDPHVRSLLIQYLVPAVSDARLVAERTYKAERLLANATTDPLTGLWSRRALTMALNRVRGGDSVALLDLDHFKRINDTLGHDAGDDALAAFGAFLRSKVRNGDVVGRLGGEEFVLLMPATPLPQAVEVVQRLRSDWVACAPQAITFSAGVAEADGDVDAWQTGQQVLKWADQAMYAAKAGGRDRVEVSRGEHGG